MCFFSEFLWALRSLFARQNHMCKKHANKKYHPSQNTKHKLHKSIWRCCNIVKLSPPKMDNFITDSHIDDKSCYVPLGSILLSRSLSYIPFRNTFKNDRGFCCEFAMKIQCTNETTRFLHQKLIRITMYFYHNLPPYSWHHVSVSRRSKLLGHVNNTIKIEQHQQVIHTSTL